MRRSKPASADDFTADTPPPRRRPIGDRAPRHVTLPPGEEATPTFLGWDNEGRIPKGCVLAKFTGRFYRPRESGYVVEALDADKNSKPLGQPGTAIPADHLDHWWIVSVIETTAPTYFHVVLASNPTE